MSVAARVAWLTDALVAPATEDVSPAGLAQVQSDLVRDLQALGAELPDGEHLEMDAFKILLAHRHPDRCMSVQDTFVASPRLCRRAVGVAAKDYGEGVVRWQ